MPKLWLVILIIVLIGVLWNSLLNWMERKGREEAMRNRDEYLARSGTIDA